jgi:hypothetical protein
VPHGHRGHCLVLASFVLSLKLWRFPGLTCLRCQTADLREESQTLKREVKFNAAMSMRPTGFISPLSAGGRFCRALDCNDLPQGREEVRAERESALQNASTMGPN